MHYYRNMQTRLTSIRLPADLATRAEAFAGQTGMTLSEFVVHSMDLALGGTGDPAIAFMARVRSWVLSSYANCFPEDVTLRVFQHIRSDRDLYAAYVGCIDSNDAERAYEMRTSLHRRIGLMVKRLLNATVVGRSLPLDPSVNLITSCALLRPTPSPVREGQVHG